MDLIKLLILIGLVIIVIHFFNKKTEKMTDLTTKVQQYTALLENNKQPNYPIDLTINNDTIDTKINSILNNVVDITNENIKYPPTFNSSLERINTSNITNSRDLDKIIVYLEKVFNSVNSDYTLKIKKVKKAIKHLVNNQIKFDILLDSDILVKDNKDISTVSRNLYTEIIISKFTINKKTSYDFFIKSLDIANYRHSQYLNGLEKELKLENLDNIVENVLKEKKEINKFETDYLTTSNTKYDKYSDYESIEHFNNNIPTCAPKNNINNYANYDEVKTEDILDIFN